MTSTEHTSPRLYDYNTGALIGPATGAQIDATDESTPDGTGAFLIDCDGDPISELDRDNPYSQPVRTVYVLT